MGVPKSDVSRLFEDTKMKFELQRKHKFLIHSLLIGALVSWFSFDSGVHRPAIFILAVTLVIVGVFVAQYPNINLRNYFMNVLLPIHLVLGAVLSLVYFPNIALPLKLIGFISFTILFYIVLLINNVFLVVEERTETIPLYRVAVTWSQIILIVVAIPFFAGVFKLPVNTFYQNIIAAFSSFLFSLYLIWSVRFDKDVKTLEAGEKYLTSLFIAFGVLIFGVSFSFVPTESFLRALFVSSVLMFFLSYFQNHFKNSITKKIVTEYLLICLFFLVLLIVFTP